jgi:RNA polymerase sigma-70 factor (ECF subfamily)
MAGFNHRELVDPAPNGPGFNTTRWSLVARVACSGSHEADAALDQLCAIYWRPVYAEIRRRGFDPDDAQDLTQDFFARLLRQNTFERAEPGKGRLRSYLLAALDHFIVDQRRQSHAVKRGGGEVMLSIDVDDGERWFLNQAGSLMTPAEAFDHGWAVILMDRALEVLRQEYLDGGRGEVFEAAMPFLAAENGNGGYEAACAVLGMSQETFKVAVYRLRKRFRLRVREQVDMTVAEPGETDAEMKHLFGI